MTLCVEIKEKIDCNECACTMNLLLVAHMFPTVCGQFLLIQFLLTIVILGFYNWSSSVVNLNDLKNNIASYLVQKDVISRSTKSLMKFLNII